MMQKCQTCEQLEDHTRQAFREGNLVAIRIRSTMLINHQISEACPNRDWYTGSVHVLDTDWREAHAPDGPDRVQTSTVYIRFAGFWPGGKPAYQVAKERDQR